MKGWDKMIPIVALMSSVLLAADLGAAFSTEPALKALNTKGDYSGFMVHAGLERTFLIHAPGGLPPLQEARSPRPLVLALHGGGGTAQNMVRLSQGRFNDLADNNGFVVLYPDGIEKHWNDGRKNESWRAQRENIDDAGFLSALVEYLTSQYNIDKRRVFSTGISNGGLMSYRLACERPELFAGIAPVTASLTTDLYPNCKPTHPISVLIINGTDDPLVPYNGGDVGFPRKKVGEVISTADTFAFWRKHDQCSDKPDGVEDTDTNAKDGTSVHIETFRPCDEKSVVSLYTIKGGGHTWPGGHQYLPAWVIGRTSREFDASDVIWRFFSSLPPR